MKISKEQTEAHLDAVEKAVKPLGFEREPDGNFNHPDIGRFDFSAIRIEKIPMLINQRAFSAGREEKTREIKSCLGIRS